MVIYFLHISKFLNQNISEKHLLLISINKAT